MREISGINKDVMSIHWLELGFLNRHSNTMHFQWKGHDMMNKTLDQRKCEVSSATMRGFGSNRFMKIGSTSKKPTHEKSS